MPPIIKYLFIVPLFLIWEGYGQVNVSGTLRDKSGALPGASVKVLTTDSAFVSGTVSDAGGNYSLKLQPEKKYILVCSFLGYLSSYRIITVKSEPLVLPPVELNESATHLSEVTVKATQTRGIQKGDTTQFNADAYKTNPDASAEDLVKKMPGITSDQSGVKVNGENVQKVLVDGKPFFGDDPNAALKNLPADIIDKVEIFDKMSDQSQFTGFSDGEEQKTINIVTKKGKNTGQFGRIYAGYGGDEELNQRYQVGAAVNSFNGKRKVTLLLLSNNINQQNFSSSDISALGGSSVQRGGGRQSSSPLLAAPQNGNTTTHSAGLNYSDEWGKKIEVSGSYFFNQTNNQNESNIVRNYFTENNLVYKQVNSDNNTNQNHRFNLRFEYDIDSSNKITIVPSLNLQDNSSKSTLLGQNTILDNLLLSETNTNSKRGGPGYDFSNMVLYQHKFFKPGRTISLRVNTQLTERNNTGTYSSFNVYSDTTSAGLDQVYNNYSNNKRAALNISYTEPVNKYAQIQISLLPSYTEGKSDKTTKDFSGVTNDYSAFNSALSNNYINIYETRRGGISYKYRKDKLNLSFGIDAQESFLKGIQTFPQALKTNYTFHNLLPFARLNYRYSKTRNLRINYRTTTNIPSIAQLQNVMDLSNPLQIKTGNTGLKQNFENNLFLRYGGFDAKTARNVMIFFNGNYTDNYISNATGILRNDTVIQGVKINSGSQLTRPVNLNGFYSARWFFVYGLPLTSIKSNINFNAGFNYNHTPSLINESKNISNSYAANGGIYIGSNMSEELDFSLGYNGNYTIVKNSLQKQSDNNFFTHATTFKVNWIINGFVLNTEVSHTLYNGLSQSFNQDYFLWNAYIGYKFFKNRSLEAKVSVFDILNQNRSINRTVTGAYTEDSYTNVLRRYGMITVTYTLKNFKNGLPPKNEEEEDGKGMRRGERNN